MDGLPTRRRIAAVIALSLGTMMSTMTGGSINVALPTVARELNVQPSETVFIVTVYQLVLLMAVLQFSALGERIGHRRVYQCGLGMSRCSLPGRSARRSAA